MPVNTTVNSSGICLVTLSRPEAMNALNKSTVDQLCEVMEEITKNLSIKGVIITGDGEKAFVAGADIRELAGLSEEEAYALSTKGQELFRKIENSSKPVIAAVNGFALGGGCELAMACHIRIATRNAKFGQPEINLGIIPGYGGTQRLAQLVGRGRALELLMTGDMITAEQAFAMGLVNHVVDNQTELHERANAMLEKIILKSPLTLHYLVQTVNAGFSFENQGYAEEARNFGRCAGTADFREGTAAFLEKRKARFSGK